MIQSSSLVGAQFILIGLGVLFQVVAFSAMRRETPSYRFHGRETDDESYELNQAARPSRPLHSPARMRPIETRDYYEMDDTPTGVKPGDLVKTAKVKYFGGVKPPREEA